MVDSFSKNFKMFFIRHNFQLHVSCVWQFSSRSPPHPQPIGLFWVTDFPLASDFKSRSSRWKACLYQKTWRKKCGKRGLERCIPQSAVRFDSLAADLPPRREPGQNLQKRGLLINVAQAEDAIAVSFLRSRSSLWSSALYWSCSFHRLNSGV